MEQKYPKTKEYIEGLLARNINIFDRAQKAVILDLLVQEGGDEVAGKMWSGFMAEDIKYVTKFLAEYTSITTKLAQVSLIDKLYTNMINEIESIIDDSIMEQNFELSDEQENRFFDNIERAKDINQELSNWR